MTLMLPKPLGQTKHLYEDFLNEKFKKLGV